ncbi:hypothetical protein HOLleu_00881 [Holothuria leucospilota]|uniref:Uncharacterized protein n=1 Tax=Holothuria leucospilota TaxID=206669 RepID=A0A9Q1CQ94_HOLLE|nr:hypothetical protein HOLleu_00881 [Holothuria leucospilota]
MQEYGRLANFRVLQRQPNTSLGWSADQISKRTYRRPHFPISCCESGKRRSYG